MSERGERNIRDTPTRSFARRFYKAAEAGAVEGGYTVRLDGTQVRTPAKAKLVVPVEGLAQDIAGEFAAQGAEIVPAAMPVTRLANSAIDTIAAAMDTVADEFGAYAGSDLLCYRAETPRGLVARQSEHWDPVLAWVAKDLGARFYTVAGIMHRPQPEGAIAAMRAEARAFDCFGLCALQTLTALTGSAVLALALARGAIGRDAAWDAAMVDEDWQTEHWGEDMEAALQRAGRRRDFDAACRVLELLAAQA
jgi:chaperone required for assembly of F1-ATPase